VLCGILFVGFTFSPFLFLFLKSFCTLSLHVCCIYANKDIYKTEAKLVGVVRGTKVTRVTIWRHFVATCIGCWAADSLAELSGDF